MARIDHVVVLMLENRSFDCMLGRLYPGRPDFDGIPPGAHNMVGDRRVDAWTSGDGGEPGTYGIPTPDPQEGFDHMTAQIFGAGRPSADPAAADMSGFAADYAALGAGADPRQVMHGFMPEQLPVLSGLAKAFAVSDRWFASAPCQTWPNRFFTHCATANGYVNNSPLHLPYMMPTVFNRLSSVDRSWRIYHHDVPQTATLTRLWSGLPDHLRSFEGAFMEDAMAGRLPNYSFIEPRYFADPLVHRLPNDQHPPHDVALGERLVARCYDAIRNGAGWERTLFIVTFDEHGGVWDHVPPPAAVSPGPERDPSGFAFDRYGVRVPAVLVSPWIPAGTVARAPEGGPPFDHTSIIRTLNVLFGRFEDLSARDAAAPDLLGCLTLPDPTNHGPSSLPLPVPPAASLEIADATAASATGAQAALAAALDALPAGVARVTEHARKLEGEAEIVVAGAGRTASQALATASAGLGRFLHGAAGAA